MGKRNKTFVSWGLGKRSKKICISFFGFLSFIFTNFWITNSGKKINFMNHEKIILILLIVQCSFCIAEAQWIINRLEIYMIYEMSSLLTGIQDGLAEITTYIKQQMEVTIGLSSRILCIYNSTDISGKRQSYICVWNLEFHENNKRGR